MARFAPRPPAVCTQGTYTPVQYEADRKAYEASGTTVAEKTRLRDKIVFSTAGEIDSSYIEFKNSFYAGRAVTETSLDAAQIGLGTAATIASGGVVNVLAAISTGLAGARLSFNKNFFKEKTPELLLSRTDALRDEQWARIYLKLKMSDEMYSLYEAERDLKAYFEKGSLEAAFQSILAESGAAQVKADEEIKKQIYSKYGESLGPRAAPEELRGIEELYREFLALKSPEKEARAKRVIEEFRKLRPNVPINPAAPTGTDVDGVKYLYSVARGADKTGADVRAALTTAFKAAQQSN